MNWNGPLGYILVILPAALIAFAVYYVFHLGPKLELCRVYYSDLSTWSCYNSPVGLPMPRGK